MRGAARLYQERLLEMGRRYALDADPAFVARAQHIMDKLLVQARRDYPEAAHWQWEIHVTSDTDENAFCMAGGKVLLGQPYVLRLGLSEAELAMLLAHELQHSLQRHNLREYEEAMRIDPAWTARPFAELELAVDDDSALVRKLAEFNAAQEDEADREGLRLAWRAGWPAAHLANYFRKVQKASPYPNFDRLGYAAPSQRWHAARSLAAQLDLAPAN